MAKMSSQTTKIDGRKAARPPSGKSRAKTKPPAPTLDSVVELFQENPSSEKGPVLSLISIRVQLESMIREAKFIDQPSLQWAGSETDLPGKELTQALKGLVKAGTLLRKVLPGLFHKETRNDLEKMEIAIARFVLARYLAALEGAGDAKGILKAQGQVDTLLKGRGIILIPTTPSPDAAGPSSGGVPAQLIQLGEAPLLDLLLPQWRLIGDSNWASPLGRHRGNWVEQAFMPVFEFLSKHLLMLFLLRGWPVEALKQSRSQARSRYFDTFVQILELSGKPRIPTRSLYAHLKKACQWAETEEGRTEMDRLLEMERARAKDAQILVRAKKHSIQL